MKSKVLSQRQGAIDGIILLLCCIVFFLPFFRGLFFEKEFYIASIAISLFALVINIKLFKAKEKLNIKSIIDIFAIAFLMLYVITFPFSINKQLASFEVIKNLTYLIIFIIISTRLRTSMDLSILNWTLILSGGVVAIIGIGSALGTFNYNGAFEGGMMSSTFQYHNTFGAYMLAALFLAMGEISSSSKSDWRLMTLDAVAYLLFTGFVLSYSRGAWVLLPVGGLLAFTFLKDAGLKKTIIHLLSIVLSFIITVLFLSNSISNKNSVKGWLYIIAGIVLSSLLSYLLDKLVNKKLPNLRIRKGLVILVIMLIAIIAIALIMSGVLDSVLPESFVSRLKGINFKTFTVVERNIFYEDALKIVKDHPIIGVGGGGWNTLYSMYKSYDYTTTQAHNYLIQTWVEVGTIGLILLIGLLISFLLSSYRIIKHIEDEHVYNRALGIICAGIVLVLHSMIDFDMSLGGYAIFVWIVYGVTSALEKEYVKNKKTISIKVPSYIFTIIILLTLIPATLFSIGQIFGDKAVDSVQNGDIVLAQKNFEKAVRFSPFVSSYKFDLGNIQYSIGVQISDEVLKAKGLENIESAINQSKFDYKLLTHGMTVYSRIGDFEKVPKIADMLLKHHPLNDNTYNDVVKVYYNIASAYLESELNDKAKEYFDKIVEIDSVANQTDQVLKQRKEQLLEGIKDAPASYVKDRFSISMDKETIEIVKIARETVTALE